MEPCKKGKKTPLLLKKYLELVIQESGIVNNFKVILLWWAQMNNSQLVLWGWPVLLEVFLISDFLVTSKLCKWLSLEMCFSK